MGQYRGDNPILNGLLGYLSKLGQIESVAESDAFLPDGTRTVSYEVLVRSNGPIDLVELENSISRMGFVATTSQKPRSRVIRICLWQVGP